MRTHQSLGRVPVGGVGHNKGPLQILAKATFWTRRTAPRSPQRLAGPWAWPCPP